MASMAEMIGDAIEAAQDAWEQVLAAALVMTDPDYRHTLVQIDDPGHEWARFDATTMSWVFCFPPVACDLTAL